MAFVGVNGKGVDHGVEVGCYSECSRRVRPACHVDPAAASGVDVYLDSLAHAVYTSGPPACARRP